MASEDVGVRLTVQGEAELIAAFKHAQESIDKLDQSINKSEQSHKKAAAASDSMTKSLRKLGEAAIAAFSVQKIAEFAREAITSASDMNETLSKSQVVFGDLSGEIEQMGEQAAKSMGLSKQEAIAAAATYGNLFTAMGMGREVSAKMSMDLVKLAADLASFNNIPVPEALEKIRAGLVGEAEPLKSLGINLNEATLKAKAMELGLSSGKGTLDASAKAQAAYALMLEQSSSAQGDFARTSAGVANQQRILEATQKNLIASIGKGLLPAWLEVLRIGNQLLGTFDQLIQMNSGYSAVLDKHSKEVAKSSRSYEEYRTEMVRAVKVTGQMVDAEGRVYTEFWNGTYMVRRYTEGIKVLTPAEYELTQKIEAAKEMEKEWGNEAERGAGLTYKLRDATSELKAEQEAAKEAAKLLKEETEKLDAVIKNAVDNSFKPFNIELFNSEALSGLTGNAYLEMSKELKNVDTKAFELWARLLELNQKFRDGKISIDDYKKGVQELRAEFLEIQTAANFKADGFFNTHLTIAGKEYDSYSDYIEDLTNASGAHLQDKTINITTKFNTVGSPPSGYAPYGAEPGKPASVPTTKNMPIIGGKQAKGGDYMVTKPTWFLAGEAGPERALFIPQAQSAGPSITNYNNDINYNLQVMTNQSPQVVQRSFAIMKMLAG